MSFKKVCSEIELQEVEGGYYPNSTYEDSDDEDDAVRELPTESVPQGNTTPLHQRHHVEYTMIIVGAVGLAFNSGFINGCTIQFRNIAVSHVTGTSTHAGLFVGNNDWENASLCFCLISCFMFGSAVTGIFVPKNSFHLGIQYGPLFIIGSCLLLIACIIARYQPDSYWYFYLAAMASGLQNALTSKYSGNIIRTTHMTGTVTDIGLVLGRMCCGERGEIWKLQVLIPLLASFICGGIVSVFAYNSMGKLSLIINVLVFFSIGLTYSIFVGSELHIPVWRAFFGMYTNVEKGVKTTIEKGATHIKKAAQSSKQSISKVARKLRGKSEDEGTLNPIHT